MIRARTLWLFVLLAMIALGWGIYRLLELRFAGGDIYPPYSTYRADPLGARALLEGFELLPDRQAQRLLEDLKHLGSGRDTTLFVLGANSQLDEVKESEAKELEQFMEQGGRVVMTFFPETSRPHWRNWAGGSTTNSSLTPPDQGRSGKSENQTSEPLPEERSNEGGSPESVPGTNSIATGEQTTTNLPPARSMRKRSDDSHALAQTHTVSLHERWGFGVDYEKLDVNDQGVAEPAAVTLAEEQPALPAKLNWHSATVFHTSDERWHAVYEREQQPVLMERAFGPGSLVLASDSYFVSNEALRKDRQTRLLAWLAGNNQRLVFDETHLGVELKPGISTLARRYRLHGLFASLLLLAALFIWKNGTSFVPPSAKSESAADIVSGRDSSTGFVNLLRRSIAPRNLLAVCFAEWQKSCGRLGVRRGERTARMAAVVEKRAATPVDGYLELSRLASEKHYE